MWLIYGLVHSLMRAGFTEVGRTSNVDREHKSFLQALCALILLLPLAPFAIWPDDMGFYIAATGASLILTAGALINFILSDEKKGRELGLHMPLEVFAAFCIWLVITPAAFSAFISDLPIALGIIMTFVITSWALLKVRPINFGLRAVLVALPIGISYAVAGNVTKTVIPPYDVIELALSYATVNFAVMTIMMAVYLMAKKKFSLPALRERNCFRAGGLAGLISSISYVAFVAAIALTPNPGYVSMMAMLLPVWILIMHRVRGIEDNAKPVPALVIIAGIAALMFLTH